MNIDFSSGWNWFSVNALQDDMSVNAAFSGLPAQEGDFIKSQTISSQYYSGFGWYPDSWSVSPENMYLLNLASSGSMEYEGNPADPLQTPVSLSPGWNWIGYVPQVSLAVSDALSNSPLVANDYIKSQTTSATFYDGYGFYPAFDMMPTSGYMLQVANGGDLIYPSGSLGLVALYQDNENFYRNYEFNGSMSISIDIDNIDIDENDILYAYKNDELRGKTSPTVFPLTGEMIFTLMVYGDDLKDEKLSFELHDYETDEIYSMRENILFEKDMIKKLRKDKINNFLNIFLIKE